MDTKLPPLEGNVTFHVLPGATRFYATVGISAENLCVSLPFEFATDHQFRCLDIELQGYLPRIVFFMARDCVKNTVEKLDREFRRRMEEKAPEPEADKSTVTPKSCTVKIGKRYVQFVRDKDGKVIRVGVFVPMDAETYRKTVACAIGEMLAAEEDGKRGNLARRRLKSF